MGIENLYLTSGGQALLARAQIGTPLIFTRAQIGEGAMSEGQAYASMKALIKPLAYLQISKQTLSNKQAKVTLQFTNKTINKPFLWYEFGLWAADPDYPSDRTKDILYVYGNAGSDAQAVPIPSVLTEFSYNAILKVDNAINVTAMIDESLVYLTTDKMGVAGGIATLDADGTMPEGQLPPYRTLITAVQTSLQAHESNTKNPHKVTAAQIGAATATDLNAHTGNKSNPHGVTKAQVGLDKVDNTADLDKPISKATQAALDSLQTELDGKAPTSHAHTVGDVGGLSTAITKMRDNISLNEDRITSVRGKLYDLLGYVGYTDADIYGVEVDFVNKRFTRLAGAIGKTAGADFDSINAFGGRRRCNVMDNGEIITYYGDKNFTTKGASKGFEIVSGHTSTGAPIYRPIVAGTFLQVMVEQPKFYYKVVPLLIENKAKGGITRKVRYYISDTPKAGFKLHPAFIQNGVEKEKIYLSAFEGSLQDISQIDMPSFEYGYILDDAQVADFDKDKLSSIAGAKPISGTTQTLSRANARKLAQNRGAGWELSYAATVSASQLLMLIEYASFNMQSTIGMGAVSKADDGSTSMAENTGATISLGNASGAVTNANGIQIVSYRGEENLWGNIWGWVDGMNVQNPSPFADGDFGTLFVSDHGFTDNSSESPYKNTGIHPCYGNGYTSAFGWSAEFDWMFVPAEKNGNNNLPVGDYYSNVNPDWRAAILGGQWNDTTYAGAFVWSLSHVASNRFRGIGARLVYIPQ